ncbi:MAG: hypothetical protein ACK5OX_19595 [Desertimonas sp.]
MPITTETSAAIVRALLDAAHLAVSDDEFDRFVAVYPIMRAQADALYLPELEPEAPSLHFDPMVGYE